MKYLCSACDQVVETTQAHLASDAVEIHCPHCGARERLAGGAPSPGADADPRGPDPTSRAETDLRRPVPTSSPPAEALAAWQRLEQDWDHDQRHQKFLALCLERRWLDHAAGWYRARGDERAHRQLEILTTMALQAMRAAEPPSRLTPRLARSVGWALFVALGVALALFALLLRRLY